MRKVTEFCGRLWRFFTTPEMLSYLVFGVLTTLINIGVFQLFNGVLRWSWQAANIVAWVLAVLFAFVTNKLFVFRSRSWESRILWRELTEFTGARLLSLGVDYACLWLLIDVCRWDPLLSKIVDNVFVVAINYVFSKLIIFRKK